MAACSVMGRTLFDRCGCGHFPGLSTPAGLYGVHFCYTMVSSTRKIRVVTTTLDHSYDMNVFFLRSKLPSFPNSSILDQRRTSTNTKKSSSEFTQPKNVRRNLPTFEALFPARIRFAADHLRQDLVHFSMDLVLDLFLRVHTDQYISTIRIKAAVDPTLWYELTWVQIGFYGVTVEAFRFLLSLKRI